jgi:hypothetical protein
MTKLKDAFKCGICKRNMRKDVHTHKVGGGVVKVYRPKVKP